MGPFLFRSLFVAVSLSLLAYVGFQGLGRTVVVENGPCRVEYAQYWVRPFLPDLVCLVWDIKPCGSFVEHRVHNAHVGMLGCLCRDPEASAKAILEYQDQHLKPALRQTDAKKVCAAVNEPWYPH